MNIIRLIALTALTWNVNLHMKVYAGGGKNWTSRDNQSGLHHDNSTRNDVTNDSPPGAQIENNAHSLTTLNSPQLMKHPHALWDTGQSENAGDTRDKTEYKGPNNADEKFSYRKAGVRVDQQNHEKGSLNLKGSPANKLRELEGLKHSLGTEQTLEDEGLEKKEQRKHEREREDKQHRHHQPNEKEQKEKEEWKGKQPSTQKEQTEKGKRKEEEENKELEEELDSTSNNAIPGQETVQNLSWNTNETAHGEVIENTARNISEAIGEDKEPQRKSTSLYFSEGHPRDKLGDTLELSSGREDGPLDVFVPWIKNSTDAKKRTRSRFRRQTIPDESPLVYREAYSNSTPCRCQTVPLEQSEQSQPVCNTSEESWLRDDEENVAFNKPAKSSSKYAAYWNHRLIWMLGGCGAVNGRLGHAPRYRHLPDANCMHSHVWSKKQWWRVDLVYVYTFREMILFRVAGDSGYKRMVGINVYVDAQLCKRYPGHNVKTGENEVPADMPLVSTVTCGEVLTGRYVAFAKRKDKYTGKDNIMNFCEVQIWVCQIGTYGHQNEGCTPCPDNCQYCDNWHGCQLGPVKHNAAIQKATAESTGRADRRGLTDGTFNPTDDRCFRQKRADSGEEEFWVRVDLEHTFKVFSYRIHSYDDIKEPERLRDFYSAVSDQTSLSSIPPPDDVLCHHFSGDIPDRSNHTVECNEPKFGRYFFLSRRGNEGFKFCELEVIGHQVYVFNNSAVCDNDNEMAVCLKGSDCRSIDDKSTCRATVPFPCSADDDCVPEAECEDTLCKYSLLFNCNVTFLSCATGLLCDPVKKKCHRDTHMPCSSNTECKTNDICDPLLLQCRRKVNASCATTDDCIAGSICEASNSKCKCQLAYSQPVGPRCEAKPGLISTECGGTKTCSVGQCQNAKCTCANGTSLHAQDYSCKLSADSTCSDNSLCNIGMKCSNNQCKIKGGWSCYGNPTSCLPGLKCEYNLCKVNTGGGCNAEKLFCVKGTACDNGTCKFKLHKNCTAHPELCVRMMTCNEEDDFTCKFMEGHNCSSITTDGRNQCRSGTHCESGNSVCKINLGQPCDSDTYCQTGTVCSDTTGSSNKKCRYRLGSEDCQSDDDCSGANVCDSQHQCMLAKAAGCTNSPALCLTGSTCSNGLCQCNPGVTDAGSAKCSIKIGKVGGQCDTTGENQCGIDKRATCNEDNTCQCPEDYTADPEDLTCHPSAGYGCSQAESCTSRSSCVEGVCLLKAGQPCGGDKSGHCGFGTVCDDEGLCRLALDQNCTDQATYCKKGTKCDSIAQRCKTVPASFCRKDDECMAGSKCIEMKCQCNTTVSVLRNGVCELKGGIVGATCDQNGGCLDSKASCSKQKTCQCEHGLVPDARQLKCAKQAGDVCSDTSGCITGTVCNQEKCKIQLGGLCGGGNRENCITGAVCDIDSKCRLDLTGNCAGASFGQCKRGTYCDTLKKCSRGVGDTCINSTDSCPAGAECHKNVCGCDPDVSDSYGATCVPRKGMYGSSCDDSSACASPNTKCVDGTCVCKRDVKPDRLFSCSLELEVRRTYIVYIVVALGILGGLITLCVFFVCHKVTHQRRKRKELEKKGQAQLQELQALKSAVSEAFLGDPSGVGSGTSIAVSDLASTELSVADSEVSSVAASEVSSVAASEFSVAASEFSVAASEVSSAAPSEMGSTADAEQVLSGTITSGSGST